MLTAMPVMAEPAQGKAETTAPVNIRSAANRSAIREKTTTLMRRTATSSTTAIATVTSDAAQDQVRAQEGKNEDAPEQNRNGDGPVNPDPARVRVEARNRFELHGEIVAIDPVARTLTLRVRNGDGAGRNDPDAVAGRHAGAAAQ